MDNSESGKSCLKKHRGELYEEYSFYGSFHRTRRKHGLNYRINPGHKQWITYIMGTGVPLLNEYKQEFVFKRLPQTILGGLKLRLGYDAPPYAYINQLVVFGLPFVLGGLFTLLVELDTINDYIAVCVYGAAMTVYVLLAQLISYFVQKNQLADLPVMKKKNLLSEEDEVDFISCCDGETFKFVVPTKKYKINILLHALVSGSLCGLGMWYLLPTTLNKLYDDNTGATVILFILGWITLLIAQYPLTTVTPPETATYRTTDWLELSALMRSFYVHIFIMFDLLHRYYSDGFLLTNQVLHVIFVFLPLLWTLGVLSPIDTFLLYILEQGHVFLYGGSFMASDLRLVVMTVLSTGVFLGAYFIDTSLGAVILSACAGYLLSIDLSGIGVQILNFLRTRNKVDVSRVNIQDISSRKKDGGFMWKFGILEFLYHVMMLGIVGVMAGLLNNNSTKFNSDVWKILGYCIIGLCVIEKLLRDIQGVFVVFSLFRNMLFPPSVQLRRPFLRRKFLLFPFGVMRRGLVNWEISTKFDGDVWKKLGYCIIGLCVVEKLLRDIQGVFVMFSLFRNMLFPPSVQLRRPFLRRKFFLFPFGVMRRGLVNWVGPLLMLSYISILITTDSPSSKSLRDNLGTSTGVWYIFGVVRVFRWIWQSTVHSLLELSVVHIILVTMDDNSNVMTYGVPILSLMISISRDRLYQFLDKSYFFFILLISSWTDKKQRRASTVPIIVISLILLPVIVGIIALASAMSVPLLPLFTLPVFFISFPRSLRSWPEEVGSSANSCPDTNFYKQLAPELSKAFSSALANGSLGEATPGSHYLVRFQDRLVWVVILERGSSYCTINIKGLELQETSCHTAEAARIDEIFESAFEFEKSLPCGLNNYPLHCLTPADACLVSAYSDARNVLTGVIDNPSATEMTMNAFLRSLVWVLLKYVNRTKRKSDKKEKIDKKLKKELSFGDKNEKHELKEMKMNQNSDSSSHVVRTDRQTVLQPLVPDFVDGGRSPSPPPVFNKKTNKSIDSWGSMDSFTDSIFSDDGNKTLKKKAKKEEKPKLPPVQPARKQSPDIEDLLDDFTLGLPAYDINKPKPQTQNKFNPSKNTKTVGNTIYRPQTNIAGSPDFKSAYSSQMSMPKSWRELPLDNSQVSRLLNKFPRDWYKHVLSCIDWKSEDQSKENIIKEVMMDDTLLNAYAQLTMACYSIFDSQGGYSGPSYLYKCYIGDLSMNAMWDWLGENQELQTLVKKAFRYGFKLMIDQLLLGELSSDGEWQEALEEYDNDWYIGLEKDPEWTSAVLDSRPSLFSLSHNNTQNTFSSRTLTQQEMVVNIGRLNPEVVRGQWANLGLELLYMTNDDEERYSIQAHPMVLRNLTVQAADPPLGYPIYSSPPISIPML